MVFDKATFFLMINQTVTNNKTYFYKFRFLKPGFQMFGVDCYLIITY